MSLVSVYLLEKERRRKLIAQIGLGLTVAFVLLRLTNLYGNPPVGLGGVSQGALARAGDRRKDGDSFLGCREVSAVFAVSSDDAWAHLFCCWLGSTRSSIKKRAEYSEGAVTASDFWARAHVLLHPASVSHSLAGDLGGAAVSSAIGWLFHGGFMFGAPDDWGFNLPFVYLMWITAVVILYFPCRWYEGVKQRRKDWWLSYI